MSACAWIPDPTTRATGHRQRLRPLERRSEWRGRTLPGWVVGVDALVLAPVAAVPPAAPIGSNFRRPVHGIDGEKLWSGRTHGPGCRTRVSHPDELTRA